MMHEFHSILSATSADLWGMSPSTTAAVATGVAAAGAVVALRRDRRGVLAVQKRPAPASEVSQEALDGVVSLLRARGIQYVQSRMTHLGLATDGPSAVRWSSPAGEQVHRRALTPESLNLALNFLADQASQLRSDPGLRAPIVRVVGGPGSGRTSTLLLLMNSALAADSGPEAMIPVWLDASTWDSAVTPSREWVRSELLDQIGSPSHLTERDISAAVDALLAQRRILAFVDDLEVLADGPAALPALRDAGAPALVVPSARECLPAPGQALLELLPLAPADAGAYLVAGASPSQAKVWSGVIERLRTDGDGGLAQALSTPLGLSLARQVYIGLDPSELLDEHRFPTSEAVLTHLVNTLVDRADVISGGRARDHLRWLAESTPGHSTFGWWQYAAWVPRQPMGLGVGAFMGLSLWLAFTAISGLRGGLAGGLVLGGTAGLAFALMFAELYRGEMAVPHRFGLYRRHRRRLTALSWRFLAIGLATTAVIGALTGELRWMGYTALAATLTPLVLTAVRRGSRPLAAGDRATPAQARIWDLRRTWGTAVALGLVSGIVVSLIFAPAAGVMFGLAVVLGSAATLVPGPALLLHLAEIVTWARTQQRARRWHTTQAALRVGLLSVAGSHYRFRAADVARIVKGEVPLGPGITATIAAEQAALVEQAEQAEAELSDVAAAS